MDTLTQIVLGSAMGEVALGKKVGNKAILWGAIGGIIPDLDVVVGKFLDPITQLTFHRGFSHSLLFALIASPILGYMVSRLHKKLGATWKDWTILFLLSIGTHPILDSFTAWGTQLLLPFDDVRIAWNTIFVVDPMYTLPFLILLVVAMFKPKGSAIRSKLNWAGIIISTLYLGLTVVNKQSVNTVVEDSLAAQNINYTQYLTNPTMANNVLWYTVVESDSNYYVGYYSFLDNDKQINFVPLPKKQKLPDYVENHRGTNILKFISKGYYTIEYENDTINFYDLRFGVMNGMASNEPPKYPIIYLIDTRNPDELTFNLIHPNLNRKTIGKILTNVWKRLKGI